jgi:hypothetical protein
MRMREGCRVYGLLARLTGCLLAVVTLLPVAVAQTDFKPVILSFEGSVEVRKKVEATAGLKATAVTTSVNISTHQTLDTGDTIVTGRNGRLVIGLADGSQAVIAPKSTVRIEDLTSSPRHLFHIIEGKTRIQIEKLGGRPNPYRVNTPTTVITVRGTIFDIIVGDDQSEVFLHEGEVEVSNRVLPEQILRLVAGQSTRVARFRPPSSIRIFSPGKNDPHFRMRSIPAGGRIARSDTPGSRLPERPPQRSESDPRVGQRDPGSIFGRGSRPGDTSGSTSRSRSGGRRF